jgi:glycosyltransferase involved in cell wall biosynthesis
MGVRASVVIACRNGEAYLAETLEALLTQRWDRTWEIVFADNGSTDASLMIFRSCAARNPHIPMRSVDAGARPGKSYAVNCGVLAARGRSLIMCDADDIPAPGWLAAMGEALEIHDLVSACNEVARLNDGPTGIYRPVPESTWDLPYAPFSRCTAGATMGFTRALFDAVGGFSTDFALEDDEFCIRAHLAGYTVHTVPEAVVHYRLRRDLRSIYRQAFQYSRTDVHIARTYRHLGPPQRRRWRTLVNEAFEVAEDYLRLRLRPRNLRAEARLRWRLGTLAGQVAGVVAYRTPPTMGLPPAQRPPMPARAAGPLVKA